MQDFIDKHYVLISDNFKKLRFANKLSQEKFAERMGCSREFISRIENYKERPSLHMILEVSYIFKITPDYFFKP